MELGLAGETCVVLGGTRGVGLETVRLLAEEGANIAVMSRSPEILQPEFDALIVRHGVQIATYAADASMPGEVERAVGAAIGYFGEIHGFVVTNHWMGQARGFASISDYEWSQYFENSLMGAVRAMRSVLPHMAGNRSGSVVLTTAYSARAPKPAIPAYAAFKAALENLVKSLAKTYGPSGIRINAVAPGALRTGRYDERLAGLRAAEPDISVSEAEGRMLEQMGMEPALGRIGDPAEVAALIVFLLSRRAAYTTGLIANVDGGTDF
ncbi:SDR family NAD(P)-dependent oxidoreductase [Hyphomonas johnsonii]|uniref:Dehydrogenase n=1 Tax=Hyphomonas johnsonii MHS-2 TaxID=1280950 RepID=A0A059FU98_9PROT|nr:SDR family oxidoreductase [Hyphomonas johnsonii]KCZ94254.1 dehydrogenase [Hyphomonas johnsonii MHS-2]